MRQSQLLQKSIKENIKNEPSKNAQLLIRASYIQKVMAGVYTFLPLGLRSLKKIENIIRDEINKIDGQELVMPALHPRELWDKTDRWDTLDVLFKLKGSGNKDLALGPTHEEVITPLGSSFITSYKDMPLNLYQFQSKFRDEARAKSGIMRGREFMMKDLYSFHPSQEDLDKYYERAVEAYKRIFERCGIGDITLLTAASGGSFSKYSHEFQTLTPAGEDTIYRIPGTNLALNEELIDDKDALAENIKNYKDGDESKLEKVSACEVGNIFKLGTKYSDAFNAKFMDKDGKEKPIIMGCYGIGVSRLLGVISEIFNDEKGLMLPKNIAPYKVHLISLLGEGNNKEAEELYKKLSHKNIEVLYDDRNVRAGEKFGDADLIGLPYRAVIGKKFKEEGLIEFKKRNSDDIKFITIEELIKKLS
ncbi:MAG: His/Gly/Thr/Pro-type tRNA ligase C-terminal domain-containing protein [Alphaproteobacteria bacterium]|jgi:prolyl-tRNA synthetase|nr:His/Gly/Thr/Pro-type tRNA ligase C-terminal domain-containing protein [Alphaproteobacteria bacterium]